MRRVIGVFAAGLVSGPVRAVVVLGAASAIVGALLSQVLLMADIGGLGTVIPSGAAGGRVLFAVLFAVTFGAAGLALAALARPGA